MALTTRFNIGQNQSLTQSLTMTPQMLQSVKLLQMSILELETYLVEEIEKNPLLERHDDDTEDNVSPLTEFEMYDHEAMTAIESVSDLGQISNIEQMPDIEQMNETFDASIENLYPDDCGQERARNSDTFYHDPMGTVSHNDYDALESIAACPSLKDHILEQIGYTHFNGSERFIAHFLTDQIDDSGYLTQDIAAFAQRLMVPIEKIQAVLEVLKGFDPAGIFAHDLAECLALQLRLSDRLDPAMQVMLDHLPDLARRDFAKLKKLCGVDDDDLADMLKEIQALDPKPGTAFSVKTADMIIPEIIVHEDGKDAFKIELNTAAMPRLWVNHQYQAGLSANGEDRQFMTNCLQNANWLIRALDQRAKTLVKVSEEIIKIQADFLRYGPTHLKPLTLGQVAGEVGLHESTISRVVSGKYMATPRGTFEMRHFFSSAIASTSGEDQHAGEAVRYRIKQLIEAETADSVLSDDALVELLAQEKIMIARRTVAKYREAMNIASSVIRRRDKKMRHNAT